MRQSRQSGLNLRKVCATFFDAVFKSADRYPLYVFMQMLCDRSTSETDGQR
jgi:hypothetical protein